MSNEVHGQENGQRKIEKTASTQITNVTSLLAGFGFAGFGFLIGNDEQTTLFKVVFSMAAITVCDLIAASVIGSVLTIASELHERTGNLDKAENFWLALSSLGIILFLVDVALFSFLVSPLLGIVSSVGVLVTLVTVFGAWLYIGSAV